MIRADESAGGSRVTLSDARFLVAGELRLDRTDERVTFRGREVALSPKAFQLFSTLMRGQGQLLSKDALIDAVWDGRAVSDAVITTTIKEIRKALNDPARDPVFIQTIYGRGYRFIPDVQGESEPPSRTASVKPHSQNAPASPTSPTRTSMNGGAFSPGRVASGLVALAAFGILLGAALTWRAGWLDRSIDVPQAERASPEPLMTPAASKATVAVLPFADLSADNTEGYFADGISEEILNVLAQIDGLAVASRRASFAFRSRDATSSQEIAERLGVRYVLEGSLRRDGDAIRINAQFIDTQSDLTLWSDAYDAELSAESVFVVQDRITESIVQALAKTLGFGRIGDAARAPRVTQSLDAYEYYLEAHVRFMRRGAENVRTSVNMFESAIALDPTLAQAHAGLAAAAAVAPSWGLADRDYDAIVLRAGQRAIELDPSLSLPYAAMALAESSRLRPDFERAIPLFEAAIERNPNDSSIYLWRGIALMALGYFKRALADFETCLRLDIYALNCRAHAERALFNLGRIEEGVEAWETNRAMGWTGAFDALHHFARIGRHDDVRWILEEFARDRSIPEEWFVEPTFQALTNPDFDRVAAYRQLVGRIESAGFQLTQGVNLAWRVWFSYGVYDEMRYLGQSAFYWGRILPDYVASDARRRLIRSIGLPAYWRKHGFPDHCRPLGEDAVICE